MYGCESLTIKMTVHRELMLLNHGTGEDSWESLDNKVINLVNPKGNQPWIFIWRTDAKAPILWPPDVKSWPTGKDPDAGKDRGQEEKGRTKDEMAGWHHWLYGHDFEQTLGDSEGHGSLVCYSRWGYSQRQLSNWTTRNSAWVRIFTPEKLVNTTNQNLFWEAVYWHTIGCPLSLSQGWLRDRFYW